MPQGFGCWSQPLRQVTMTKHLQNYTNPTVNRRLPLPVEYLLQATGAVLTKPSKDSQMNKLIATLIVGAFSAAAFAATPAPVSTDAKPVEATAPVKKAAHKKVKIAHAKKAKADGVAAAAVTPAIK